MKKISLPQASPDFRIEVAADEGPVEIDGYGALDKGEYVVFSAKRVASENDKAPPAYRWFPLPQPLPGESDTCNAPGKIRKAIWHSRTKAVDG